MGSKRRKKIFHLSPRQVHADVIKVIMVERHRLTDDAVFSIQGSDGRRCRHYDCPAPPTQNNRRYVPVTYDADVLKVENDRRRVQRDAQHSNSNRGVEKMDRIAVRTEGQLIKQSSSLN